MHCFLALLQSVHLCPVSAHSEHIIVVLMQYFAARLVFATVVADEYVSLGLLGHLVEGNAGIERFESV